MGEGEEEKQKEEERRRGVAHLLFEVPPLLLVHQNQVDIVTNRELLVDVPHGGRQVIPTQEQANGNGLPCRMEWRRTHNITQQQEQPFILDALILKSPNQQQTKEAHINCVTSKLLNKMLLQ